MIQTLLDNLVSGLTAPYFITSVVIMLIIMTFSVLIGHKVKKMDPKAKPGKFISLVIGAISFLNNFVKDVIGKHWRIITPIILSLALYIFISNISGITGLPYTPTKYSAITFSLSIIAVFVIQMMGFISKGKKHINSIIEPTPFIAPLNIIGEITPVVSLALRLFGNVASGALILFLVYSLPSVIQIGSINLSWLAIILTPIFHLIFDIGFGLIQTVVFVLLTLILSSTKIDEDDLNYE